MRCTAPALDRRQGGSVLLETALVVPLLLLFVLGAVDLGLWVLETPWPRRRPVTGLAWGSCPTPRRTCPGAATPRP